METDVRAYGTYYSASGTLDDEDEWSYSTDETMMRVGGDLALGSGQLGIAYSSISQKLESDSLPEDKKKAGYNMDIEAEGETLDIGYFYLLDEATTLGILATNISQKINRKATVSVGTFTDGKKEHEGEASVEYWQYEFAASNRFDSGFSLGVNYAPSVEKNKNLDGDYTGFISRNGHGNQLILGAGFQQERYSLELDYMLESEQESTLSGKGTGFSFSAEYLIAKNFAVLGNIQSAEYSKVEDKETIYPKYTERLIYISATFQNEWITVDAGFIKENEDFKDDDPVKAREDKADSTTLFVSVGKSF